MIEILNPVIFYSLLWSVPFALIPLLIHLGLIDANEVLTKQDFKSENVVILQVMAIKNFWGALRTHHSTKSTLISKGIGLEEWIEIRKKYGVKMCKEKDFSRQFLFQKFLCKMYKLIYFLINMDLDYILKKLKKTNFEKLWRTNK